MCGARLLSNNSYGCVTMCNRRAHVQVCFGNVLFALTQEEFSNFNKHICCIHQKHFRELMEGKKLFIKTERQSLMIAFSGNELNNLKNLLSEASLMMEVEQILNPVQHD